MNKKHYKYILLVIIIIIIVLKCKPEKQPETLINQYTIPENTDIYSFIDTLNYYDTGFIKDIIGSKIANKAQDKQSFLEIVADYDSLYIQSVDFKAFNAGFNIELVEQDSVKYFVRVEKSILRGGSIFQTLTDLGMQPKQVGFYAWKMGEYIDATSIDVGDILTAEYYVDSLNTKHFQSFSYQPDKINIHTFEILGDRELKYALVQNDFELKKRFLAGKISENYSTLDAAMDSLGIIPYIRQQANNALASQIAFSTDARIGDTFEVYIEEVYMGDELQQRGKMLYVQYSGKYTRTKSAYRYQDEQEASAFTGMYTAEGKRLVTDAVRTPLDRMHITSPYGFRIHPVTGRRKMHQGMDLRGWTGTPIYAVTEGTVVKAADSGNGYGKEVRIRHSNGMITQYAHMSRISTSYGRRVKKGQLIGKIGSTGVSTGPHLHFGVMKNGRWVNPKTNLKMVGANKLAGDRLKKYKEQMNSYKSEIENLKQEAAVTDTLGRV